MLRGGKHSVSQLWHPEGGIRSRSRFCGSQHYLKFWCRHNPHSAHRSHYAIRLLLPELLRPWLSDQWHNSQLVWRKLTGRSASVPNSAAEYSRHLQNSDNVAVATAAVAWIL